MWHGLESTCRGRVAETDDADPANSAILRYVATVSVGVPPLLAIVSRLENAESHML